SGAAAGDGGAGGRAQYGPANLHRRHACRWVRRARRAGARRSLERAPGRKGDMTDPFTAACLQLTSGPEVEPNIAEVSAMVRQACSAGAQLVLTPENTTMVEPRRPLLLAKASAEADHPAIPAFAALAGELGIFLLIGSLTIRLSEGR